MNVGSALKETINGIEGPNRTAFGSTVRYSSSNCQYFLGAQQQKQSLAIMRVGDLSNSIQTEIISSSFNLHTESDFCKKKSIFYLIWISNINHASGLIFRRIFFAFETKN